MNNVLEWILKVDKKIFVFINTGMANPVMDLVMPFMRNAVNWAPLYLFVVLFFVSNFGKKGWWWVLFYILTVTFTDSAGTYIFKHNIDRLRPCKDPYFSHHVRLLLSYCSSGHSFVSNHAANHFGLATFFYFTCKKWLGKWALAAFFWAFSIAFAQVYVGIHYPTDILAGSLLGIILGIFTSKIYKKRFGSVIFDN